MAEHESSSQHMQIVQCQWLQLAAIWESGKWLLARGQMCEVAKQRIKGPKHVVKDPPKRYEQSCLLASCLLIDRFPCDPMFFFFLTGKLKKRDVIIKRKKKKAERPKINKRKNSE